MPYTGVTFSNVSGATTAVAGDIIQSAVWDAIHTDYAIAFTRVMSQLSGMESCRNALYMNGGLEVWQRGAGSAASIAVGASTLAYTADRWYLQTGANQASIVSAQAGLVGPATTLVSSSNGSNLSGRVIRNAAQTGTGAMIFAYPLDTDEIARLRGNKVSFNMSAQAGANWSPTSGTLNIVLYLGTGASPAKRNTTPYAGETQAFAISTNMTVGGSVATITGGSSAIVPLATTQAELQISWSPTGTAGAADSITIDNVQVEPNTSDNTWTITNFDYLPFWLMYTACQRHYWKTFNYGVAPAQNGGGAGAMQNMVQVANVSFGSFITFPVVMRVTASVTSFNPNNTNANWRNITTNNDITAAIDPNTQLGLNGVMITGVSVSAATQMAAIHITASAGI